MASLSEAIFLDFLLGAGIAMAGHVYRHPGAQLHGVVHYVDIDRRLGTEALGTVIQVDRQGLRIVVDILRQRLMDLNNLAAIRLAGDFQWLVYMMFTFVPTSTTLNRCLISSSRRRIQPELTRIPMPKSALVPCSR